MRFLVDENLPAALARWLTERGYVAEHASDLGFEGAPDRAIWDYALLNSVTIVTKDQDFALRKALTGGGPTVIWIRLPNTRRQPLLAWFEAIFPEVLTALQRGEALIELV